MINQLFCQPPHHIDTWSRKCDIMELFTLDTVIGILTVPKSASAAITKVSVWSLTLFDSFASKVTVCGVFQFALVKVNGFIGFNSFVLLDKLTVIFWGGVGLVDQVNIKIQTGTFIHILLNSVNICLIESYKSTVNFFCEVQQ